MIHRLIAIFAAATVLLAAGCSSAPAASVQNGADIPAQLQFSAETLDGHQFSGDSLLGKPAVLWFWAPWCPACQSEAPMVGRVAAANPTVTFVGVGAQDELPALKTFVEKYRIDTFTQLADTHAAVWSKFDVTRQPAFAFVSPDGAVDVTKGQMSESDLTERVHALAGR